MQPQFDFNYEEEYYFNARFVWNTQRRIPIEELTIAEWQKMGKPDEALELIRLKSIVDKNDKIL